MIDLKSCKNYKEGKIKFLRDLLKKDDIIPLEDFDEAFNIVLNKDKVSERDSEILVSYYFNGMTYKEISEKVGLSAAYVGKVIRLLQAKMVNSVTESYFIMGVKKTESMLNDVTDIITSDNTRAFKTLGFSSKEISQLKQAGIKDIKDLYNNIVGYLERLGLSKYSALKLFGLSKEEIENMQKDINVCTSIEILGLSVRAYSCLMRSGYTTIDSLKGLSKSDLLKIRNFGKSCAAELQEKCEPFGLKFE